MTAITVHPKNVHSGADLTRARAALTGQDSVEHVLLALDCRHDPYGQLDEVPVTDEPAPSTITYPRLAAQLRLLAELGSDCHLTGDGGDTLLCPPATYLQDLLLTGRLLRLAAHAQGWARLRQASPWPLITDAVTAALSTRRPAAIPEWLTPTAEELARTTRRAEPEHRDSHARAIAEIQTVGRTAHADAQLAEAFGVTLHNPFTDPAVVDAVASTRTWDRGSPWSYKPLLTAALVDVLPHVIAQRGTKGTFDTDHHRGLRANLDSVLDLADGRLAALGLVAPAPLRQAVRRAAAGLPTPFGSLEPTLAAEVWLRALVRAEPVHWAHRPASASPRAAP